jgi:hypothetical protein
MTKNAYAAAITEAMEAQGRTLRDLERAIPSYSYEHIRSVVAGDGTSFRKDLNDGICDYLDLDRDKMWATMQEIRAERKFGIKAPSSRMRVVPPPDGTLRKVWAGLSSEQKAQIVRIAAGMAEQNKAMRDLAQAG